MRVRSGASCWTVLDIGPTDDRAAIKRAYAARLKSIDRERDIDAFQELRAAYDAAIAFARSGEVERFTGSGVEFVAEQNGLGATEERPGHGGTDVQRAATASDAPAQTSLSDDEVETAVREILDACGRLEHSDALMAYLEGLPALHALADVDRVGHQLALDVQAFEDIRYPMLAALVERFDWDAVGKSQLWRTNEQEALHAFLRRRHLRELIDKRALPIELRTHYDDLRKHVQPPFGFWRALRVSSLLLRDLRESIDAIRNAFSAESELIVSPEAEEFIRSVYSTGAPRSIRFASAVGRAYGLSLALITLFLIIGSIARGILWAFLNLLTWWLPIFVGCVIGVVVVRALRRLFGAA